MVIFVFLFYRIYVHHHKKLWFKFNPSLSIFYEDQNEEQPLTKFEQFSMCSFGQIFCQCWHLKTWIQRNQTIEIYVVIELSLSLNDSLIIILTAPMDIFKKMDT